MSSSKGFKVNLPWYITNVPSKISIITLSDCDLELLKDCVLYTRNWSKLGEDPTAYRRLTDLYHDLYFDDEED